MTMRRRLSDAACLVAAVSLSACATQHLNVAMQAPAPVNLKAKGVHALAVLPFEGPGESGTRLADLVTGKLAEGPDFTIVEREKLRALESEQVLGMAGVVDGRTAAKAGKVLGADALLVGKAEQAYRTAEKITPKTRYLEAVGHVRAAAEPHRRLEEEK
ncbi:MAG: CsgG/HfaB family protein [Nitrospirota bacterium]